MSFEYSVGSLIKQRSEVILMGFESVEEVLEFLLDINNQDNDMKVATVNPDGTRSDFKKATLEDYKESNREAVYALCDMLGLEKVYLDKWEDEKVGGK